MICSCCVFYWLNKSCTFKQMNILLKMLPLATYSCFLPNLFERKWLHALFTFTQFYLHIFHFTQGHCVLQAISPSPSQAGESLPDNFIGFDSAPDKVVDGSLVRVRYRCSRPCQLAVEAVVSTLKKTDFVVFRRKWIGNTTGVYRIHQVLLRWPPSILYQHDFFNRRILDAQNVTVRAWLNHLNNGSEPGTYHASMVRIYKVLQIKPLSERPTKPPAECPSWSAQLMWQLTSNRINHCPHESGQTLKHIYSHCPCFELYWQNFKWFVCLIFCCFPCTQTESIC